VPNLLHGTDGRWSALDSRAVHRHALTASYLYHAVLRGQLTARLGVAWTPPCRGVAEVAGVPAGLIEVFSTRRRQILRALEKAGRHGAGAAQAACLASRPPKDHSTPAETTLRQRWAARARTAGHDPDLVIGAAVGRTRPPRPPRLDPLIHELLGPGGLTAHATGFDRRDLLQALCQAIPAGMLVDRARLEAAANLVLRQRDAIRLATRTEDGPRWSTAELLGVEQHALALADELRRTGAPAVRPETVAAANHGPPLSPEQQHMVAALANTAGLAVVVGPAGAGKTAALAAATHAWSATGRPVTGAALAAVTARRLEHATGIPSRSLARLLADAADPATGRPAGLPRQGVIVVDEASMVDTRTLAVLLAHTKRAAGTLVLIGDPAQLPEIRAGGLFAALARHPDTIVLADNRRQTEPWERRALTDLRAGDPQAAIAAYAAHDRIHAAPSGGLPERVVTDYLRLRHQSDHPEQVVMLAVRRADVALLNQLTRERLLANGQLGEHAVVVGAGDRQREYRTGDQVIVTTNDHRRGLLNGTRAALTHVDERQRTMTLATDDQRQITVPAGWAAGRLDHGYALTCHKAQGATVDTALLYGAGTLAREAGYVGLSRGRRTNHLYTPDDTDPTRLDDDRLADLTTQLATSRAQTLATRQLPGNRPGPWPRRSPDHALHQRSEGISR